MAQDFELHWKDSKYPNCPECRILYRIVIANVLTVAILSVYVNFQRLKEDKEYETNPKPRC
jgi:hypothetical protein